MTVISEAAEGFDRGFKQERDLLISTRHDKKLKEVLIKHDDYVEHIKKYIGDDDHVWSEFISRTVGSRPLDADLDDYAALLRRLWSIIEESTTTSAGKIKKIKSVLETFDNEHKEKVDESYIHDTIDK